MARRVAAVRIVVGPDSHGPPMGVSWYESSNLGNGYESDGSGVWTGPGPRRSTPDAWVALLRRHHRLPSLVRKAGQKWVDADVTPDGYSQGAGHAPEGVMIEWTL